MMKKLNVLKIVKIKVMNKYIYFTISEIFRTCNNDEILQCISNNYLDRLLLLVDVLEAFREEIGCPIYVTSSFRSPEHNERVGGSSTSQHLCGEAIDFVVAGLFFDDVVCRFKSFIKKCSLREGLGQVIFYYDKKFIHLALSAPSHPKLQFYEKGNFKDNH